MSDDYKYDGGKLKAAVIFQDFPLALKSLAEVATYGVNKYKRHSWLTVPNALERYSDAMSRHMLEHLSGESVDIESGLKHYAHFVWNALATFELLLIEEKNKRYAESLAKLFGAYPGSVKFKE